MKNYICIPSRYKYGIVVAQILRENTSIWDFKEIKAQLRGGKIRVPDLEDLYFQLERTYTTLENFCECSVNK